MRTVEVRFERVDRYDATARTLLAKAGQLSDSRRVTVNTVFNGAFYKAGDPLPVSSADDLPEILRPFVVTSNQEPEAEARNPAIKLAPASLRNPRSLGLLTS